MPAAAPLIEKLASEHSAHLAYLRGKLPGLLADDEFEDALQQAYFEAHRDLGDPAKEKHFATYDHARGWLRCIAVMRAVDIERSGSARRLQNRREFVDIDTSTGHALRDDRVSVEADVVNAMVHHDTVDTLRASLDALADDHRQVLKLRFDDNLSYAAITHLLDFSSVKACEGKVTRALKALATEVSKRKVTSECGRTRLLLKRNPEALLDPYAVGVARNHVESCFACQAFGRSAQLALASTPLPFALDPIREAVLQYLPAGPRKAGRSTASGEPSSAWASVKTFAGSKLAVASMAAAVTVGGAGVAASHMMTSDDGSSHAIELPTSSSRPATWAESRSDRQKLEQAARDLARARAQAANGSDAVGDSDAGR